MLAGIVAEDDEAAVLLDDLRNGFDDDGTNAGIWKAVTCDSVSSSTVANVNLIFTDSKGGEGRERGETVRLFKGKVKKLPKVHFLHHHQPFLARENILRGASVLQISKSKYSCRLVHIVVFILLFWESYEN